MAVGRPPNQRSHGFDSLLRCQIFYSFQGGVPEWSKGTDCNPVYRREFESLRHLQVLLHLWTSG